MHLVGGMVLVQATLGIKTLLLYVPVGLGAAHQGGAVVLIAALLFALHETGRAPRRLSPAPATA
jgi:cytochrome c oxidase assembly protein subunit 15